MRLRGLGIEVLILVHADWLSLSLTERLIAVLGLAVRDVWLLGSGEEGATEDALDGWAVAAHWTDFVVRFAQSDGAASEHEGERDMIPLPAPRGAVPVTERATGREFVLAWAIGRAALHDRASP